MEIATTAAYRQQEFPSQISAMDAFMCSSIARHVESALKGAYYDEARKFLVPKRTIVMDERSPFSASSPYKYEAACVTTKKAYVEARKSVVSNSIMEARKSVVLNSIMEARRSVVSNSIMDLDWRPPFSASPHMCETDWVPAIKAYEFSRAETVNKSMDPSLSVQEKIMINNRTIVVADKIDGVLCFEYMPKGNNDEYHDLDWQTFNIVMGICKILEYLHQQLKPRICHLDLKPANILLDWNMMPKIMDFGLSLCLSTGRNGIVKHDGRIVVAEKIDRLLCYGYMQNGNLDEYHGLDRPTSLNTAQGICTGLAYLHEDMVSKIGDFGLSRYSRGVTPNVRSCCLLLTIMAIGATCSKSPEEFAEIAYQNWMNKWKFESSSKQIKRLNQIVLSCLETGKSMKATSSTVSTTHRAVHDSRILDSGAIISATVDATLPDYVTAPNMMDSVDLVLDSNGFTLAAELSVQQHLLRNSLTDERSDKPRSNRAAATNSSDETTRAPVANKLTDDEAENHSDPNSCVAERDAIEKEKRSGEWYVATGAAHHATSKRDLFRNMVDVQDDGLCVHAADGTPMPVCGRGDVVTDDVVLPDVYYVPLLCNNLVAVGQLAGLDYCIGFGRGACVISSADGAVVGRAHARGDGLYEVDFLRVPLGRGS